MHRHHTHTTPRPCVTPIATELQLYSVHHTIQNNPAGRDRFSDYREKYGYNQQGSCLSSGKVLAFRRPVPSPPHLPIIMLPYYNLILTNYYTYHVPVFFFWSLVPYEHPCPGLDVSIFKCSSRLFFYLFMPRHHALPNTP